MDAVGQKDMVYWGFSYGTLLGQTYAGMYPERSHRVIIDGVVNQFDWYNEFTNSEDFVDTVNAMDGFFSECIKAAENCTLASVIKTNDAKELKEKVLSFIEGLYDEPLSVYVNSTVYGTLDYETLMYKAIFESLYRPPSWYGLADALAKLIEGNGTDAFLAYSDVRDEFADQDEAIHFVTQNDGKSGLKYWPEQRRDALEIILGAVNSSIFGPGLSAPYYIKRMSLSISFQTFFCSFLPTLFLIECSLKRKLVIRTMDDSKDAHVCTQTRGQDGAPAAHLVDNVRPHLPTSVSAIRQRGIHGLADCGSQGIRALLRGGTFYVRGKAYSQLLVQRHASGWIHPMVRFTTYCFLYIKCVYILTRKGTASVRLTVLIT